MTSNTHRQRVWRLRHRAKARAKNAAYYLANRDRLKLKRIIK